MKQVIKCGIKIYLFFILYLFLSSAIYSLVIYFNKNNFNPIIQIIIGSIGYLLIGFCYGNAIHKKGLLFGLLIGLVHFFLIKGIFFLAQNTFDFSFLLLGIDVLLAGIGGILGMNFKKIF